MDIYNPIDEAADNFKLNECFINTMILKNVGVIYNFDINNKKYNTLELITAYVNGGGDYPIQYMTDNPFKLNFLQDWVEQLNIIKINFYTQPRVIKYSMFIIGQESVYISCKYDDDSMSILLLSTKKQYIQNLFEKYGFNYSIIAQENNKISFMLSKLSYIDYKALSIILMYLPTIGEISNDEQLSPDEINELLNTYPKLIIDHILYNILKYQSMMDVCMNNVDIYHEIYNRSNDILEKSDLSVKEIELINYYMALILFSYPKSEENDKQIFKHLITAGNIKESKKLWNNLLLEKIGVKFGNDLGFDLNLDADTIINLFLTIVKDREEIKLLKEELNILKK